MKKRITLGIQIDQLVSGYARLLLAGVTAGSRDHDANLIVFSGRVLRSPLGHQYQNTVIFDYIRPGTNRCACHGNRNAVHLPVHRRVP